MNKKHLLIVLFLILVAGTVSHTAYADTQAGVPKFFAETGHTLAYSFRQFYEQHGGEDLFGLPITEVYLEDGRPVQYFERARLEWDGQRTETTIAYLGRSLVQRYQQHPSFQPRPSPTTDVATFPGYRIGEATNPTTLYFPDTKHAIGGAFLLLWIERGRAEMFGYPLTEEIIEHDANGTSYTIQYFEKARFEYHPNQPSGKQLVFGNLGREYVALHPAPQQAMQPVTSAAYAWDDVRPTLVRIPRIGINTGVVEQGYTADEWDVPRFTAAHYWPLSAYPGTAGNIVISGHVGYSGIIFNRLSEAQVGDEVFVRVGAKEHRYIVREVLTVLPYETWVMNPTPTETLTLYTCYPIGTYTHRLVVRAEPAG